MHRFGYFGQVLHYDLSSNRGETRELDESVLRDFLGGVGLGTQLLLSLGLPDIDALAPESPLVISFSPLVGSPLTTSARFAIASKSPLTDRLNDSLCGSRFAIRGKSTGLDAIVVSGRCESLSVLVIDGNHRYVEATPEVAGMSTSQTNRFLRERFGAAFESLVIGPAGEHCVRYATVTHDGRHAGRGGSGAVMGSKNLKAILVRGDRHVSWANKLRLTQLARKWADASRGAATAKYRELGTASNLSVFHRLNGLPSYNFQSGQFAGAAQLAPESLSSTHRHERASCAACTIGCEHRYSIKPAGHANGGGQVRVEYESMFALGSLCGVSNPDVVLAASQRCDELGLDSISTGGTLAYAMECAERGWWPDFPLRFNSDRSLLSVLDSIAHRRGVGDALAEGSRVIAGSLGGSAPAIAPHVKGLELPGYEPRRFPALAVGLAVGTRGADHNRSSAYEIDFSPDAPTIDQADQLARKIVAKEDQAAILDSAILCKFLRHAATEIYPDLFHATADVLEAVTGWDVTAEELASTARRIVTARKLYNARAGWTPAEDDLPARFFTEEADEGRLKPLDRQHFGQAITAYNLQRGWDFQGFPQANHLEACRLNAYAEPLESLKSTRQHPA